VIDLLDRYLQRLLQRSDADLVVIWSHIGQQSTGSVVCSQPADVIAAGDEWPVADAEASPVIHRDPAVLAALVPQSVRPQLAGPPVAAMSLALPDPDLVLLVIWCAVPVDDVLGDDLQNLINDEITYAASGLGRQNRLRRESHRLEAVIGNLSQGVVSVDDSSDRVTLNPAAAELLGLTPGEVLRAEFESALAAVAERAVNHAEATASVRRLAADRWADIDSPWRFAGSPTHVHLTSRAIRQGAYSGRVWVFDDVSDTAQALHDSDEAQALLRASADALLNPQGLLEAVRGPDGRLVDLVYRSANRSAYTVMGISEGDLVGTRLRDTFPELERSGLLSRYAHCLETGEPVVVHDFQYPGGSPDDRRFDIQATRAGPDLLALTWSNVTARFRAAQRLAESELQYRLIAENSGDMVAHLRDGRFVWVSPSAQEILGAPPERWIGREFREIAPDQALSTFDEAREILQAGKVFRRNVPVVSVDGVAHWVHLHAKPFRDADGNPDGFTAALRLIDDEMAAHQAAEAAHRQEAVADARYRRSMDTAAIGMCLLGPGGAFLEVNPALCEMLGYDAATLTTMTWQEITPPEWLPAGDEERRAVFGGSRNSYRIVKQYFRSDGRRIWVDVSVNGVRDEDGRVEALASQMIDITAEVRAREELERSDERNRSLARQLREQTERLEAELRSAAEYLASIMPRGLNGTVEVVSRYLPSRELGGDCFDYTWIDDDHLLVYLIDVSGHGIEPALLSVSVHNLLRSGSLGTRTLLAPEAALSALNRMFQMDKQGNHYFTIWYGVYQASTRTLRYSSAGAPPAFAFRRDGDGGYIVIELSTPATPIGMFEDTEFTSSSYHVPPGCRLLIFSDGAHELVLHEGRQMTLADFKDLTSRRASTSRWWIDDLIDELMALTPTRVFQDDCSLIQLTFD
jgi:sigma-B regulation protein RsbU (phosphoserine phosphatase)